MGIYFNLKKICGDRVLCTWILCNVYRKGDTLYRLLVELYKLYIELLLNVNNTRVKHLTSCSPEQELISFLVLLARLPLSSPCNTLCASFRILTWEMQEICKLLCFCFHSKRWWNFWIICKIEKWRWSNDPFSRMGEYSFTSIFPFCLIPGDSRHLPIFKDWCVIPQHL